MEVSPAFVTPSDLTFALLSVLAATGHIGPCPCDLLTHFKPTGICHANSGLREVGDQAFCHLLSHLTTLPSLLLCSSPQGCCLGNTNYKAGTRPYVRGHPKRRGQPRDIVHSPWLSPKLPRLFSSLILSSVLMSKPTKQVVLHFLLGADLEDLVPGNISLLT